jgi:hypothetical protein
MKQVPVQPVFALSRNAVCLAEKQKPTIYRTRGEHANHYVTDAVDINSGHFHYIHSQIKVKKVEILN